MKRSIITIVIADLSSPSHAAAIVYLLNEYAKDDMGGGAELTAFVQDKLIAEHCTEGKTQCTHAAILAN